MAIAKDEFLSLARKEYGNRITRAEIEELCEEKEIPFPHWFVNNSEFRVSRGIYSLGENSKPVKVKVTEKLPDINNQPEIPEMTTIEALPSDDQGKVPSVDPLYVPFGPYEDVVQILATKRFFPFYVTGPTGNGKTTMIEQACAELNRSLFRVNITEETDEDDLLGGFRLVNDSTMWFDGPVIKAMKEGAVLLLDEVDLARSKIMCLQPVLEGKGVLLKKINQFVRPSPGFTIVATANTKGQGCTEGKYIGTNILNEAFLSRFAITFEQPYPPKDVEKDILNKVFESYQVAAGDFADKLVDWAEGNRISVTNGADDQTICTRRLVLIAHTYSIFKDRKKAVQLGLGRFETITQGKYFQLYEALDSSLHQIPEANTISSTTSVTMKGGSLPDINAMFGTNL